jgi:hypothetical protein
MRIQETRYPNDDVAVISGGRRDFVTGHPHVRFLVRIHPSRFHGCCRFPFYSEVG